MNEPKCIVCGRPIPEGHFICLACGEYDEQIKAKPKTNGDRIRQMTNEELADIMQRKCECCAYRLTVCAEEGCESGVLEWLKQEAD